MAPRARAAAWAGARTIAPLAIAVFPFGLVYGVLVANADLPAWVGGIVSILVVAGASQIALVDLIDSDAPVVIAVATALIINLRLMLYSTALAPAYREFPRRWQLTLGALITDQTTVTALAEFERESDPVHRRWWVLGASALFVSSWVSGTWIGIVSGASIPASWELGFAIPLTFIALLVPALRARADIIAASVAAVTVVVAAPLPFALGLPLGAVLGVAAGMMVRR